MPAITIMHKGSVTAEITVHRPVTAIGRSLENDIVINHETSSRHHADVVADQDGYFLRDMGSANGTFLNQEPIEYAPLRDGDKIAIGEHLLLWRERVVDDASPVEEDAEQVDALIADWEQDDETFTSLTNRPKEAQGFTLINRPSGPSEKPRSPPPPAEDHPPEDPPDHTFSLDHTPFFRGQAPAKPPSASITPSGEEEDHRTQALHPVSSGAADQVESDDQTFPFTATRKADSGWKLWNATVPVNEDGMVAWLAIPSVVLRLRGTILKEYLILHAVTLIGRAHDCDIYLDDSDRLASRYHARILYKSGGCYLQDLQSGNGIFVNGIKVERIRLCAGDLLQIGEHHLIFSPEEPWRHHHLPEERGWDPPFRGLRRQEQLLRQMLQKTGNPSVLRELAVELNQVQSRIEGWNRTPRSRSR